MTHLNWPWIVFELTAVPALAAIAAFPIWWTRQIVLGNLAGTGVIFAAALGLIFREHIEISSFVQACLEAGTPCWPTPSAFTRFFVYAAIGLAEVFVLFSVSLRVEERRRRRDYSPEWR